MLNKLLVAVVLEMRYGFLRYHHHIVEKGTENATDHLGCKGTLG
jgi:hypothetical protein